MEVGQVEASAAGVGRPAAAKVSASCGDAEEAVIGRERWEEIHRLKAQGLSVSALSRELGLDRKTIRRCLRQGQWHPYRREAAGGTLLAAHAEWLAARAPQVQYSARILFQELRKERGYAGSYDTVRNAVRPLRTLATQASVTQRRFETAPGEQAQVDWGQVQVRFANGPAAVHFFVLTLGYSRRAWAEGYENERLEALLSAHEHAFAHFGGVAHEILYDRMRTVVLGSEDGRVRWNAKFEAFSQYWGFTPRVCRPYRAQTKGKVESGVKYIKRNFLPGRSFRDLDDFNAQLRSWLAEVADVRVHGTTHERPIDRFAQEAPALIPVAGRASSLQAMRRSRRVADDWLVAIDGNRYSVPWRLIGQTVEVLRVGGMWQIHHRGKLVAEHPLLPGRHQLSVRPEHGPGPCARNARKRYAEHCTSTQASTQQEPAAAPAVEVEVRDLATYQQLLEAA